MLDAGRRHGVPVGYPTGDPTEINRRIAQGFRFFQASSDIGLLAGAARDLLSKVDRGRHRAPRGPEPERGSSVPPLLVHHVQQREAGRVAAHVLGHEGHEAHLADGGGAGVVRA